jgi:uncharacterized membrane protein YeaQ/YmgE (transglycosylase-associated protein family)
MTLLGFLLLLIVAAIVGAIGEMIGGTKIPGGWMGSIVAGLVGAWIGAMLIRTGATVWGIDVISAIIGAAIFVFAIRLMTSRVWVRRA